MLGIARSCLRLIYEETFSVLVVLCFLT
ncbi:unnamed protein product [Larinioides sclopetarius]|uniref:Uncharacterized protein n=1 Tax=Larinioides sclopetarius TaxID=280406 RepID=A0AAV2AEX3_9ARAC